MSKRKRKSGGWPYPRYPREDIPPTPERLFLVTEFGTLRCDTEALLLTVQAQRQLMGVGRLRRAYIVGGKGK